MRWFALLVAVLALASAVVLAAQAPASAGEVSYRPPVDGPIVDPYRPPPEPWQEGNRGIDYAPGAGTPVKAAADGEVVFAGQVGGTLAVTILHPDGIRTSYSFLESVAVHRGDQVRQGQVIGTSGDDLNFGARVGDDYIDPSTLFDAGRPVVYLVPDGARQSGTEQQERSVLSRFLSGVAAAGRAVAAKGASGLVNAVSTGVNGGIGAARAVAASPLDPASHAVRLIQTTVDWWRQRNNCTPASVDPPPVVPHRVAVLVGGIGSSSDHNVAPDPAQADSLDKLDAPGLGYDSTVRFSYLGGDAASNPYRTHDTTVDLRTEARLLRDLLEEVHREHPDDTVDVIAHSQGGVVARAALAEEYDPTDSRLPRIANLVTLASPHDGAPAATALTGLGSTPLGFAAEHVVDATGWASMAATGDSVRQLAEGSAFLSDLDGRSLPAGIRFTSIGSEADLLVPGVRTRASGARNVLVTLPVLENGHSDLPGSPQGRREVALAVSGMPPTCRGLAEMLADTVLSDAIATGEDLAGQAATGVAVAGMVP